jgi:hypothetical protein
VNPARTHEAPSSAVSTPSATVFTSSSRARDEVGLRERALVDLEHEVHLRRVGPELLQRLEQPRHLELDRVRVQEEHGRLGPVAHQLHGLAAEEPAELGLRTGSQLARDVEQLHRALGEAGHPSATEGLVRRHARGGKGHDGLEEHRHRALVDELADL